MRALGQRGMPGAFALGGMTWRLAREVKHDFWAATGFYDNDRGERVVLKASRAQDFAGVPLSWVGRWLRNRELRMYLKLSDVRNVPRVLGTVGKTGFVMQFVHAQPLPAVERVPDGFFSELRALLGEVHRRGIAYVDMNKRANILVGEDGRPYLVDFQISWDLDELGNHAINRRLLAWLQREDLYHLAKHHARLRPDELTAEQRATEKQQSTLIRLHRLVTKPWFWFRRRTMSRLRETGRLLPEGSE
jgi:hypothetical protein